MQLNDLRRRIDSEIDERTRRKSWRNHARDAGKSTWWETEDSPRIQELGHYRQELSLLHAAVQGWGALSFLPPGRPLSRKPNSTPLFRNHPVYRRVFRVIVSHFLAYQATLDTQTLLTRARSLPVLYEWWCAVQVMRALTRGLQPLVQDTQTPSMVSTKLAQEGKRFTIEFAQNQSLNFVDAPAPASAIAISRSTCRRAIRVSRCSASSMRRCARRTWRWKSTRPAAATSPT